MELNELRHIWNRQETERVQPLSEQAVAHMVARKSDNVVAKIRRNAWLEVGLCVIVGLALPFTIYYARDQFTQVYMFALLLFFIGFCAYYYPRKLGLLRRLEDVVEQDLHRHLQQIISSLRGLLAIYMRLLLVVSVVATLANLVHGTLLMTGKLEGSKLAVGVGIFGLMLILFNALVYWAISKFARWYLHRLYGQHIDRLESYLQELQHD